MKIGLVGEAPNDTQSIQNLLEKRYSNNTHEFVFMLQRYNGSQLDSNKTKKILEIECKTQKPDIIIFIRDLDSLITNKKQQAERKEYFKSSNKRVNNKGIFLLHIYEIEALILTDVDTFNLKYSCNIQTITNVMTIAEPKEYLKKVSKKYSESHNADIFKLINFEKTLDCEYFRKFIENLDKLILS